MALDGLATHYPWLVPLIPAMPVLGFAIGIVFGGRWLKERTPFFTVGAMAISTILAWGFIFLPLVAHFIDGMSHGHPEEWRWSHSWAWAPAADGAFRLGVMVDHLTGAMLAMVTLVVLLIEIYSIGYMHGDENYSRFHSYVSLFAAGMLGLVVSNNYFTLLVSWEIMGLCSYLLIGFWYFKDSARKAAKKAFMVTRVGDMGMLIGIMVAYAYTGSFEFAVIFEWARDALPLAVCVVALGLFMGSVGKSAQFPLHVWLPDAMEGPTPVSALIHAATMVSAGVYLVARSYPLFYGTGGHLEAEVLINWLGWLGTDGLARVYILSPMSVVAWIGGFTALLAASMACFQVDIKKVLAYSTISQLGYMFLALGVGGYTAACFHLLTHAFFKALLFLGSGSVIHAVEHAMHEVHLHEDPQNMYNMGGLAKKMPATYWTFLAGTLALAGIFPFAGFFSKDEILLEAGFGSHDNLTLFVMGMIVAFLTAYYMWRLMCLTFYGAPRYRNVWEHVHDSPKTMTVPLMVLSIFAVIGGLPALPALLSSVGIGHGHNLVHEFINLYALGEYGVKAPHVVEPMWQLALLATLFAVSGIALGWLLYATRLGQLTRRTAWAIPPMRWLMTAPKRLYWLNEALYGLLVVPLFFVMKLFNAVDRYVIDLIVNLIGWLTLVLSSLGRLFDQYIIDLIVNALGVGSKTVAEIGKFLQSGKVQGYALVAVIGLLLILAAQLLLLGAA